MISHLLENWRTSVTGVGMVVAGLVHIGFMIKAGGVTEAALTAAIMGVMGGLALLAAEDGKLKGLLVKQAPDDPS
jgi:hypothetical protein